MLVAFYTHLHFFTSNISADPFITFFTQSFISLFITNILLSMNDTFSKEYSNAINCVIVNLSQSASLYLPLEMAEYLPIDHGFVCVASRFLSPVHFTFGYVWLREVLHKVYCVIVM